VLDGGTEAMLAGFQPFMRRAGDVLVAPYPVDRDLHLDGRGLLLVPSYFCRRTPLALVDPSLPPVLVYPAWQPEVSRPAAPGRVVALLGRTRAGVLHSVRAPSTTSEIARRLLVSAATASEHLTVLRDAGLVAKAVRELRAARPDAAGHRAVERWVTGISFQHRTSGGIQARDP
jgi:DNA-binding transcriptional ArsR family regulator